MGIFALDLFTKWWISKTLPEGTYFLPGPIPVIDDFFYIVHVHNHGAAWSQFSGYSYLLGLLGILALLLVYVFRGQIELSRTKIQFVFGLISGGIAGNVYSRLAEGYVVDFLDFHLPGYRWPAFNIADCGISVGVFLYLIIAFISENKR